MNIKKWFGFESGGVVKKEYAGPSFINIFGGKSDTDLDYKTTWVNTAVNIRAVNLSKANIYLYRKESNGPTEVLKHPFIDLIYTPNLYQQSMHELLYLVSSSLDVYGEAYLYVALNKSGKPNSLYLLPTNSVTPMVNSQGIITEFTYQKSAKETVVYTPDELIYFKLPNLDKQYRGQPTIDTCKRLIDIDNYQQIFQKKFFINDGSVNVVLETDDELGEEAYARLKKTMNEHTGADNSNGWLILQDGLKYNTTKTSQKEMDFVNSRTAVRDEILGKMSVPKTLVGISDTVNRATADAEIYSFTANVIIPLSLFVVDKINIFIKKYYGQEYYIKFEYDTPADLETYQFLNDAGAITKSELREAYGFSSELPPELLK